MEGLLYENLNSDSVILETYPFNHRTYKLFSDDVCKKLIENFNNIKNKMTVDKGLSQSRFMIGLNGDSNNGIDFYNYTYLLELEPLNIILNDYVNIILPKINKFYQFNNNFKFRINLVYDTKDYSIGPHTDSYLRKATMITYLVPECDKNKNLGVSLYKDLIDRHKNIWKKDHYDFIDFEKVKQMDYYSGSTIDFKVNKNSFHGVEKIQDTCERMSIQAMIL
tara:strand:+ start:1317 stop:1982 length:666 start_codon:yes stop_codon:yes gene_type:complete